MLVTRTAKQRSRAKDEAVNERVQRWCCVAFECELRRCQRPLELRNVVSREVRSVVERFPGCCKVHSGDEAKSPAVRLRLQCESDLEDMSDELKRK